MTPSFYQLPGRTAFSVAEVCARTGIGRDTIYDAVRTRKLAARKIGRRLIITERALHRFLESLPKAGKSARLRRREPAHDDRETAAIGGDS